MLKTHQCLIQLRKWEFNPIVVMSKAFESEEERIPKILVQCFKIADGNCSFNFNFEEEREWSCFRVVYEPFIQVVAVVSSTIHRRHRVGFMVAHFHRSKDCIRTLAHDCVVANFGLNCKQENTSLPASPAVNFGHEWGERACDTEAPSGVVGNCTTCRQCTPYELFVVSLGGNGSAEQID